MKKYVKLAAEHHPYLIKEVTMSDYLITALIPYNTLTALLQCFVAQKL